MSEKAARVLRFLGLMVLILLISGACTSSRRDDQQGQMSLENYQLDIFGSKDKPDEDDLENMKAGYFGASGSAFTPDGRLVAVGTREMIWVADTKSLQTTGRLRYQDAARFGNSKSLVFVDDQRLLVGADGAIMLWDLKEGLVTHRILLQGRSYSPRAITWSAATNTLAFSSGGSGSPVKLVHLGQDGFDPAREFPGFVGVPSDLQFSRDGRYLAAAGDGEGVYIRDVETGESAGELPTDGFVSDLELFGESQLLVAGNQIVFWTFMREDETVEFENPGLQGQIAGQVMVRAAGGIALGALALFVGAFATVAAPFGGADAMKGAVELGRAAYTVASDPVKTVPRSWCGRSTAISSDGRWLADVYPGITSEIIQVYDLQSSQESKRINPRGKVSCAVKFSPDGKQLLITTNNVARLYDTKNWTYSDLKLARH